MSDSKSIKSKLKKLLPDEAGFNIGVLYAKWGVEKKSDDQSYDLSRIPRDSLREIVHEIDEMRQRMPSNRELVKLRDQARTEITLRDKLPKNRKTSEHYGVTTV